MYDKNSLYYYLNRYNTKIYIIYFEKSSLYVFIENR